MSSNNAHVLMCIALITQLVIKKTWEQEVTGSNLQQLPGLKFLMLIQLNYHGYKLLKDSNVLKSCRSVGKVEHLRAAGQWFEPPANPWFKNPLC